MKKLVLICIILPFFGIAQEQNFLSTYEPSVCKGNVPEKITNTFKEKLTRNKEKDKSLSRKNKKINQKFYESSHYYLDQLLRSGKVLFGDEMTNYVNKVAYNLLEKAGKESLKTELSFFVLKSSSVNAFTMQDGSVFVTVGLLAQIENEAELAFVLAHEIAHFELNHNIEFYKKSIQSKENSKKGVSGINELLKKLSNYSKSSELEADIKGLKTLISAGYNSEMAKNSLFVIQYSFLPFDDKKFALDYFNSGAYKIPKEHFKSEKSTSEISDLSSKKDEFASHPNIEKRINNIETLIEKNSSNKQVFFLSEKQFNYINTKARFEVQFLGLLNKNFLRVVYESYLLQENFPNNKYLSKSSALGLYGIFKLRISDERKASNIIKTYNSEGEILALKSLLIDNMSPKELALLTIFNLDNCNDSSLIVYRNDVISDLFHNLNFDFKSLLSKEDFEILKQDKKAVSDTSLNELDSVEFAKLSKIEKIKYNQRKDKLKNLNKVAHGNDSSNYYLKIFSNKSKEGELFESMKKISKSKKEEQLSFGDRFYRRKKNLDSILVLEPIYVDYKTQRRRDDDVFYEESILKKNKLRESIEKVSKIYDKRILNLESSSQSSIKIEDLNADFLLKEWYSEVFENKEFNMLTFSQARANRVFEKYDCKSVMISVILDDRKRWYKTFKLVVFLSKDGKIGYSNYIETYKKGHPILNEMFINDVFSKISKK